MTQQKSFVAVDLGASSGRVIIGRISEERIEYEEIHRFGNDPISRDGRIYWDIESLKANVFEGLSKLAGENILSVGVDAWAVDYGLIDQDGNLIGEPRHYRDECNVRGVSIVETKISARELYRKSGLQFLPFNTLYQLSVDQTEQPSLLDKSYKALLIPDLFNFWLSGVQLTERTNASTTGLLDPVRNSWNIELIQKLNLQIRLLADVVADGTYLGRITPEVQEKTGLDSSTQVVTVGSHDTASAFVAVPSTKPNSLFISSGTWSLLGVELEQPILTEAARVANFTNEGGVDGRIRFLKNVTGLWLLQECSRKWRQSGNTYELRELIDGASRIAKTSVIDVNNQEFLAPGDMPQRIKEACRASSQSIPQTEPEIARVIFDSLVAKYVDVISELESLTGNEIERIHIVGGGSQNELLNQLISNKTGLEVFAGPVEATAIGNLVVQARAAGVIKGTLEDVRALIAKSFEIKKFSPITTGET